MDLYRAAAGLTSARSTEPIVRVTQPTTRRPRITTRWAGWSYVRREMASRRWPCAIIESMELWIVWVILAIAFGFGELHTNGFYLAPFVAGALIAALLSLVGVGFVLSTLVFIAASVATLTMLRPLALRHRHMPAAIRTGTAALIGRPAVVVERIANAQGIGLVKIGGEVWTARALDPDGVIEAGSSVEVVEIRGATALVME